MFADKNKVLPYYFPTTVAFVDDDPPFLANFSLELDEGLAYRLFHSPQAALRFIDQTEQAYPLHQRCCTVVPHATVAHPGDQLIRLDVTQLEQEIGNPNRFDEVSVVVVDYDMPKMNGLEFCRLITNQQIKKILLTGVGDEKIAVAAFNEGLIDRFVSKSERRAAVLVNRAIRELQYEYLQASSQMLRRGLQSESAVYLNDAVFGSYFRALCRREGFVEYYLSAEPSGFLLLTADARMSRLLVFTEADMQAQWEVATDHRCPAELAVRLQERQAIPYFPNSDGYYRPEIVDWESCLHTPEIVVGRERYYVALVPEANSAGRLPQNVRSYADYLASVDAVAPSA